MRLVLFEVVSEILLQLRYFKLYLIELGRSESLFIIDHFANVEDFELHVSDGGLWVLAVERSLKL